MKTIGIYNGAGASPTNAKILKQVFDEALHPFGVKTRYLNHDDLNEGQSWRQKMDALVIGGGAYGQMKAAVHPQALQTIKEFASEKSCIGICMGGYGLSSTIEFMGEEIRKTSDGMGVFNGHARGSLPITPVLYNGNSNSTRIMTMRHEERGLNFPALYWGGPAFHMTDNLSDNVKPIITMKVDYAEQPLVMGVRVDHEQGGKSFLLGYHSEATKPDYLSAWIGKFKSSDDDFARIQQEIAAHQSGKYYLGFAALLDDAGFVPDYSFVDHIIKRPPPRDIIVPTRELAL